MVFTISITISVVFHPTPIAEDNSQAMKQSELLSILLMRVYFGAMAK